MTKPTKDEQKKDTDPASPATGGWDPTNVVTGDGSPYTLVGDVRYYEPQSLGVTDGTVSLTVYPPKATPKPIEEPKVQPTTLEPSTATKKPDRPFHGTNKLPVEKRERG